MRSEEIAKEIGALVDHLRASDDQKISLTDIAAATEVLLQATRMYFKTIDTSVFSEVRKMSTLISQMRSDVAQLRPDDLKNEKIPRAGLELDAVVKNTEDATNTIMESAEEIMSVDLSDEENRETFINNACMRIFEACSFQDITGQRVNKVVKTLTQIEERLDSMQGDWATGLGADEIPAEANQSSGELLLHGPALEGEGADQSEVDALLKDEVTAEEIEKKKTVPAQKAKKAAPPQASQDDPKSEPKVAAKKAEPSKTPEPSSAADGEDADGGVTASQSDIDALFD